MIFKSKMGWQKEDDRGPRRIAAQNADLVRSLWGNADISLNSVFYCDWFKTRVSYYDSIF